MLRNFIKGAALTAAMLMICFSSAAAQTETIVHRFIDGQDGDEPTGLVAGPDGRIYGKTQYGGDGNGCGTVHGRAVGCGTIFAFSGTTGPYRRIYIFTGTADGGIPEGQLIFDSQGNLYGTTALGGANGRGTVFELSPPSATGGSWTLSTLYNLTDDNDGFNPAGLALDHAGNLYVTTPGYPNTFGNVFELLRPGSPGAPWTYSLLYTFAGSQQLDGTLPSGALQFDNKGNLYGTTQRGGGGTGCFGVGCGIIYELQRPGNPGDPWTEIVLYRFAGLSDGYAPAGGLSLRGSTFYGTTAFGGDLGGGTVFQFSASGLSVLDALSGGIPGAPLGFDTAGNIYTTTYQGGSFGNGTVLMLSPSGNGTWTETVLHMFQGGLDGALPTGGLVANQNGVFGTTLFGGTSRDGGIVYQVTP